MSSSTPDGRPAEVQPLWRRDFPIDLDQEQYVTRRDFTKFMVLTSLAFVVGQFSIALQSAIGSPPASQQVRQIGHLDKIAVGGAISFHYPGENDPCLLLRPDEHTLVAYSQKCTHLSCAVVPQMARKRLYCPCHEGSFDVSSGRPVAGPPRRPLPRIRLEVRDGAIFATGVEKSLA